MSKISKAAQMIADGGDFTTVMKDCKLSKEELMQANNSIEGFEKISTVVVSDGKVHPKGQVLAW